MPQITSGIRSILSYPRYYQFLQDILGKHSRGLFVSEYVRPVAGDLVLDVGCGTGDIINYLPKDVRYIGLDLSVEYIEIAKQRHGRKGAFYTCDVRDFDFSQIGNPDIVMMRGLLHHLSDNEVTGIFTNISHICHKHTRVITIDPCYLETMSPIARLVVERDRGQNVRTPEEYKKFAEQIFLSVELATRTDLLRIPYAHAILQCSGEKSIAVQGA